MSSPASIRTAAAQFGPFDGRVWLNTAHQGPLPRSLVAAASRAAEMKASTGVCMRELSAGGPVWSKSVASHVARALHT
jgi:hypothetical protein